MPRKTAQQRRVEELLKKQTAAIQKAFKAAMQMAAGAIDERELVRLLELGQIERAAEMFRIERGVLFPLEEAVRNAFIGGGIAVADDLPKVLSGRFGFDGTHTRAIAWVEEMGAKLVTNIVEDAVNNARNVITDGVRENRSSGKIARELSGRRIGNRRVGGIIGLTEPQTDQLIRARSMLGDPEQIRDYFIKDRKTGRMKPRYKLSDRRFDAKIKAAVREGRALSGSELEAALDAHKAKATGHRGRVVARNEAFTAQAASRDEAYRQMLDDGKVESATCRWQHNLSENARHNHQEMDGTVVQIGEDFVFPDGTRMSHPHDPRGGAEHSAGCKCVGIYRIRLPRS